MKNKKGTHVDVILSFILFISFLIFMFVLLEYPLKVEEDQKYTIQYLENKISEEISENVGIVYLTNSSIKGISENCISVNKSLFDLNYRNYIAQEETLNKIKSKEVGEIIYLEWTSSNNFFKIYYSNQTFNSSLWIEGTPICQTASIKGISEKKEYFETKVLNLLQNYTTNYTYLKSYLGVPLAEDFGLQFEYSNGTILGTNVSDLKTNILIKKIEINYLDKNAQKLNGKIRIYSW